MALHQALALLAMLGAPLPDSTTVASQKPPAVLAENICEYTELDSLGWMTFLVAFHLHNYVNDKPSLERPEETVLFSLNCYTGRQATPRPDEACSGAMLDLGDLIEGRSIASSNALNPISRDWNGLEFHVVERTGSLFRLASEVERPHIHIVTKTTIIADFSTGRVTYAEHVTFPDKTWDRRGEASCKVHWRNGPPAEK